MPETTRVLSSSSPSPGKTRAAFLAVFAACYGVSFFVVAVGLHTLRLSSAMGYLTAPLLMVSFVVTTLIFRKKGTPVVTQSVEMLEPTAHTEEEAVRDVYELHSDRNSWRGLTALFGTFTVFIGVLAVFATPKPGDSVSVGAMMGVSLAMTIVFAVFGWLRPSLLARVDEEGVTVVRGWGRPRFIPWAQIAGCRQTQTDSLIFNSTGFLWDFQNGQEKSLMNLVPTEVPEAEQRHFARVVARYLSR